MTPVARKVNTIPKPHVHVRWSIKDGKKIVEEYMSTDHPTFITIEEITRAFTDEFKFVEYNQSYASYADGGTEYIRFEGTLLGEGFKLTADVFSCYCEPLNEDQEPPF